MTEREKRIKEIMSSLMISREQASELLREDERIDKMTRRNDIEADLTEEQRAVSKELKQASRKTSVYKFDTSKRKKSVNVNKKDLISFFREKLEEKGSTDIIINNPERELVFSFGNTKYKLTLSQPRG